MRLTFQSSLREKKGKVQTRAKAWADPSAQPVHLQALDGAELVAERGCGTFQKREAWESARVILNPSLGVELGVKFHQVCVSGTIPNEIKPQFLSMRLVRAPIPCWVPGKITCGVGVDGLMVYSWVKNALWSQLV